MLALARALDVSEPAPIEKFAILVGAFVLAELTYRFVEKPVRFGVPMRVMAFAASATLALAGCFGVVIYAANGVASRFPAVPEFFIKDSLKEARAGSRAGECFVDRAEEFSADCDGVARSGGSVVMLWGDSFAADLYFGLQDLQRKEPFQLAQYTSSGCPPVFSYQNEQRVNCRAINEFIGRKIASLRPQTVLMAARWELYDGRKGWDKISDDAVRATIVRLKAMGVRRVVAIGQFPVWQGEVPRILAKAYRTSMVASSRNSSYLRQATFDFDDRMRRVFSTTAAMFVSPLSSLCNGQGCLLVVPGSDGVPLSWDDGHLTNAGSSYFVEKNKEPLLGPILTTAERPR